MPANSRWDLTFILLTWRKWWAPNNASKQYMEFNSGFKGLITCRRFEALTYPVTHGATQKIWIFRVGIMKISGSFRRRFVTSVRTLPAISKHVSNIQLQMSRGTNQYFLCPSTYKNCYLLRWKAQAEGKTLVMGGKKIDPKKYSFRFRQTNLWKERRASQSHTYIHIYQGAVKYVAHSQ